MLPENFAAQIIYEDNHLIAVSKLPLQRVQPDPSGPESLELWLKEYIRQKYSKPGEVFLGVIHRIDRPVSGVVLFARTSKALVRMNEMIRDRRIAKRYLAIVRNKPPEAAGTLIHHIRRDPNSNKSYASDKPTEDSRPAELRYRLLVSGERYHLLEIELITGRHHQIRAQLSAAGWPIQGDIKYGFPRTNPGGVISLHSWKAEFEHPVTKEKLCLSAPPPTAGIWHIFGEIRNT